MEGGCLFLSGDSTQVTGLDNSFQGCAADIGGAIAFQGTPPSFHNTLFLNNSASLYGANNASYPVQIALRTYAALPPAFTSQPHQLLQLQAFQSGAIAHDLYAVLLDTYGQVVASSDGDQVTL